MKRSISFCLITMLLIVLTACSPKKCEYCESTDVRYETIFVASGTKEYLCEECFQKRNENPTFDDLWIINPV